MKTQNPWMGRVKGSAGQMTGCKVYDKNVFRAKAFEVSNPKTNAQMIQRAFFAKLTALITDFSDEQLRTLFPQKPKTMSRRNMLSKQIAEYNEMDNNEKVIAYADIDTFGNAKVMDFGDTTFSVADDTPTVTLDQSVINNQSLADYYFIAALVNETKGDIYLGLSSAKVSVGSFSANIPSTWSLEDEIHAIPFITDSKDDVYLRGFGSFIIKTRPEKKGR